MTTNVVNPYESPNSGGGLSGHAATSALLAPRAITLMVMILAAAATRIIPHPWNFTAVGAMCLFGGAYFLRAWQALLVPLAALFISDLVLAVTTYGFATFGYASVWLSYGLFALTVGMGTLLRGRVTFVRVITAATGATVMFFLVSNFFAWLEGHAGFAYTPAGLLGNYIAALPFARNMLLANLFYSGVLFGGYELLSLRWPVLRVPVAVPVVSA